MNDELKNLLLSLVDMMHLEIQAADDEIKCKRKFILDILNHIQK